MRHFNITKELPSGLSKIMVTQESNNFGDQILSLKRLADTEGGYEIVAITSRSEGDWMQIKDMKNWYETLKAKGES